MDEVVVKGQAVVSPTKQSNETVYTGQEVTREGVEIQGNRTSTSVYEAASILPGVSVQSADALGLAAEQRNIRMRGVRGYLGALTVDGIPNYGPNPIGPREYLYDMENMETVAVYKGAVPADLGTGVGARGGAIALSPLWPQDEFNALVNQAYGSFGYHRTFARIDTGSLPKTDTALSLSYSFAQSDKWKGSGDLGPRNNFNIMLSQPYHKQDSIRVWFNYNDIDRQNLYRALTYDQASNLDDNYRLDFNDEKTGSRGADINYYDYNVADYTNKDMFAVIPFTVNDQLRLELKPYYSRENAEILQGTSARGGLIQKRLRDVERYGFITEGTYDFSILKTTLGYLFESSDVGVTTENYLPTTMEFQGVGMLTKRDDNGRVHSPYLTLAGTAGRFDWQAGVKYFRYTDPAYEGYTSQGSDFAITRAPDLDRGAKTYDAFLPTAGVGVRLADSWQLHASYGRTQVRPYSYVPLVNAYSQNRAAFQAAGVTLDDLFDGLGMEKTDTMELGVRYAGAWFECSPTVFYSKHKDLLVTISDPRVQGANGRALSYRQNMGKATGYGLEMANNVFVTEWLTLFANPSYTALEYDEDLVYQGSTISAEGNQLVDTPRWQVKSGVIFRKGGFEIAPQFRYVGDRYGDAAHTEKIGDYVTADVVTSYTFRNVGKLSAIKAGLEFYNILDRHYISVITASDDSRGGSASYLAGAPFTAVAKVGFEF